MGNSDVTKLYPYFLYLCWYFWHCQTPRAWPVLCLSVWLWLMLEHLNHNRKKTLKCQTVNQLSVFSLILGTNSIHLQGLSHLYAYIFSQHWPFTLFPLLSHHVEWFTFYTLVLLKSSKSSWEEALDLTTPHTGRLFVQSKAQRTIVHNTFVQRLDRKP